MKNFKLFLILSCAISVSTMLAQPYYYHKSGYLMGDSVIQNYSFNIMRINFDNPSHADTFLSNHGEVENILIDETQNWIALKNYTLLEIINTHNTEIGNTISENCYGLNKLNFSPSINKLILLFDNDNPPDYSSLVLVDPISLNISDTISYSYHETAYNYYLSNSGSEIYFFDVDTLTRSRRINVYSIVDKNIARTIILDTLVADTKYKWVHDIKNDIALISYDLENTPPNQSYYFTYNINNNSNRSPVLIESNRVNGYLLYNTNYFILEEAIIDADKHLEIKTGKVNVYKSSTNGLITNLSLSPNGKVFTFSNYPNNIYYYNDSSGVALTFDIDSLANTQVDSNLIVKLVNSQGALLATGTLQYYEGSWKDAVNNGDGTFTVITNQANVSLRMTHEYVQQTVNNITAHNNTYTFQTVNAVVQLKNSLGNLIDAGTVQYYAGAWRTFGTTTNGVATKELLPINYSFRMSYAYASIDKQQNLSTDPIVVFQTVNAAVQLKNSLGNLIDQGTVQYYSGAWRTFGTTTSGVANKELLPINYSFRMTYEYASTDKQQDLSTNPIVVFQTVNAAVQLKNSLGNLIDQGIVQYYAGAWRSFGTTTNGVATKELLPINYSFRMTHAFLSKDKQQNLSTNSVVDFTTVLCSVKVSRTNNQPINNSVVKYYAGAWRDLGVTNTEGITTKELLPQNISFRASYGNVSLDKPQDIGSNNLVEFLLNIP